MAQAKTQFGYRRHPDQDRPATNIAEYPVVVVGAGPVGLSLSIDTVSDLVALGQEMGVPLTI